MRKKRETIFLAAFEENQEKLFRICTIYSRDLDDAKDLFQEALVHIWRSMETFKGNSSIGTWMYRITLNVCLRFKSRHSKKQNRLIRLDSITMANFRAVEDRKVKNDKLFNLRKCVKKLNEGDKAVMALYLEGLAYKEISGILGLSENNIAVKVKRIKSKLHQCINKQL